MLSMVGCVNLNVKSMEHPLLPRVMKAPFAQSRRHLRVAFVCFELDSLEVVDPWALKPYWSPNLNLRHSLELSFEGRRRAHKQSSLYLA